MTRQEIPPDRLAGATVVVLDVFLATTTLLTIFENGARGVYPVGTLDEAEELNRSLSEPLRGGEQGAEKVEGYDLGPFPVEYSPESVGDREVIFVTTNGTRAIAESASAEKVIVGCLRNAPAVARYLETSGTGSVYLVCAGSGGRFTLEDFLGASTILSHMQTDNWRLNDAAWMALDLAGKYREREADALKRGRAGRWFDENDWRDELNFVGDVGASDLVPLVVDGKLQSATDTK